MAGVYSKQGYEFTPAKQQWTAKGAQRMRLSQLIEDGIKRNSKDETASDNQGQCMDCTYTILMATQLASKEHKHKDLDFSDECDDQVTTMSKSIKAANLYEATPTKQAKTIDFRWIKCNRKAKKWSTMKADEASYPHADLELLVYLGDNGHSFETVARYPKNAALLGSSKYIVKYPSDPCWYAGAVFIFDSTVLLNMSGLRVQVASQMSVRLHLLDLLWSSYFLGE